MPSCLQSWTDFFGNQVTYFTVEDEHRELTVTAITEVAMESPQPPPLRRAPVWEDAALAASGIATGPKYQRRPVRSIRLVCPRDDRLVSYAAMSFTPGRPLLEALLDLTARIFHGVQLRFLGHDVATPTMEVFDRRHGVCQDFAHLRSAVCGRWAWRRAMSAATW